CRRCRRHRDHLDLGRQDLEREVGAGARQKPDPEPLPVRKEPRIQRRSAGTEPARQLVDGEMANRDEVQRPTSTTVRHEVILWGWCGGVNYASGRTRPLALAGVTWPLKQEAEAAIARDELEHRSRVRHRRSADIRSTRAALPCRSAGLAAERLRRLGR